MKAAVLEELSKPLAVREVGLTELKFGQVLVKILVSGICGAQLHEIKGHKGNGKFLPHLMGHEGCGIVEAVGIGVTTVKVGDKVVMHWRPGTGPGGGGQQQCQDRPESAHPGQSCCGQGLTSPVSH